MGTPCKIRGKLRSKVLRNKEFPQKKVLSLVLCVAVMLSVMVMGAGAAFSDQDKIENTEAVNMCTALNIIGGYEDGSYHPERNIERSEITKMICVALNGGKEPNLAVPATPTFSDVRGSADAWAEKYIESCAAQGIVSGVGGGRFSPAGNVTGSQLAKMLLVALGYRADEANFTGNGWDTNVNVIATQKGLYEGLENMDVSAALTRDNAAQMIWNALQAVEVEYTYTLVTENGQLVSKVVVQDKAQATVGTDKYDYTLLYDKYKATVTDEAVLKTVDLDAKGTYTLTTADGKTYTKVAGDYTNLLGQSVRVVCKMDGTSVDSVYGVFAADDNAVVSARVNQIESLTANKIEIDGTEYNLASTGLYHIQDGVYASGLGLSKAATSFDTFTLIDNNGDDKYDGAVITTVTPAKVTYASSTEIIAGGTTYKAEDHNIAADIAKDDYVTIVYNIAEDKNDIVEVAAITGEVDGEKTINGAPCVRVNGEWYAKGSETMTVDNTYTFYAVNGVVVSGSVDESTANIANLIMVLATDNDMLTKKAMVMDSKGETKTVSIDSAGDTAAAGEMYTFTETDKGYKLTNAATIGSDYIWTAGADGDVSLANDTIGSTSVSDDAVIFVLCKDGGVVITGKQFNNLNNALLDTAADINSVGTNKIWDNSFGSYTSEIRGLDRVSYAGIFFNGNMEDLGVTSGNEIYAYVTSDAYKVSNSYTSYTIWNGSENLTVTDKGANPLKKGDIITYDAIDGDYITGVSKATLSTPTQQGIDGVAYVAGFEGDYVYLDGTAATNKYEITGDTKYLYVDSNEDDADSIGKTDGEMVLADKFADSIYRDNVIVLVNTSGELELVVVDVKNDMTTSVNATHDGAIGDLFTNATESLSKTKNIKAGDAIVVTFKATGTTSEKKLKVENGKLSDSKTEFTVPAMAKGDTWEVTVFATGNGNVSIKTA